MLGGALVWRGRENGAGKEKKEAREFLDQLRLGKVYLRGRDRPRTTGGLRAGRAASAWDAEPGDAREARGADHETARCLFTARPRGVLCVFDMTGFALSNMAGPVVIDVCQEWQPARFVIKAFEANYPECLGAMLIHNAPWVFSGVWKIIRSLLDPVVAAKVDFTRTTADLERHIPLENIPSRFGGGRQLCAAFNSVPGDGNSGDRHSASTRAHKANGRGCWRQHASGTGRDCGCTSFVDRSTVNSIYTEVAYRNRSLSKRLTFIFSGIVGF
ncbi:hypothetical protein NUW58_g10168 [Xylaria curta]|uniref:Uncharacterized protein n=1 Tax=Xylaria curta TaxID=42375 RepID=A0ACC1MQS2_9PEZI|nr:hypothetical protein NUW58_g10168 [Xylaria curta]